MASGNVVHGAHGREARSGPAFSITNAMNARIIAPRTSSDTAARKKSSAPYGLMNGSCFSMAERSVSYG